MQDLTGPPIAVIPARGGSKRIPRKNARPFAGKPMIAWPMEIDLPSGLLSRLLVSTEDHEIAQAPRHRGAEVPFVRPAEFADENTHTGEVMAMPAAVTAGGTL